MSWKWHMGYHFDKKQKHFGFVKILMTKWRLAGFSVKHFQTSAVYLLPDWRFILSVTHMKTKTFYVGYSDSLPSRKDH